MSTPKDVFPPTGFGRPLPIEGAKADVGRTLDALSEKCAERSLFRGAARTVDNERKRKAYDAAPAQFDPRNYSAAKLLDAAEWAISEDDFEAARNLVDHAIENLYLRTNEPDRTMINRAAKIAKRCLPPRMENAAGPKFGTHVGGRLKPRSGGKAATKPAAKPSKSTKSDRAERSPSVAAPRSAPATPAVELPELPVRFEFMPTSASAAATTDAQAALADYVLRRDALAVTKLRSFDTLLFLEHVKGVDSYEYQLRTVRRVLRDFRGRVLLADEVGLGKTVEAGMCLKEYLLRGLVGRALILTPPALRGQWRDELLNKFGVDAAVIDGDAARRDPKVWSETPVVIASLGTARLEPHASRLTAERFDLVVVDEAHRLKNRRTKSWALVDGLKSRFLMLLSATPVENDLVEIYNMLSLLRPGLFSTEADFRKSFIGSADGRSVKNPAGLRRVLREVMIRNTRALAEANLPPRFAATLRAAPSADETRFYADLATHVRAEFAAGRTTAAALGAVLRAAGSSPAAAASLLERHVSPEFAARARALRGNAAKDAVLLDLLAKRADEKVLLFAGHLETLEHVRDVVRASGRKAAYFHGSLSPAAKEAAVASFAADHDVLVASESGGEGFNMHFARTVVNYDLPWNPMRIEQRIGRVHRIGQKRDVFVFNLVATGTVEEEILRVLDEKINMFELVVGEIEAVLGRLGDDEREFQDLVLEIYAGSPNDADARRRFDELADSMTAARKAHEAVKSLETAAFGRDLEA